MAWSPSQYLKFENERTRPSQDLIAHIGVKNPRNIYDLGCGPGNSTEILASRFENSQITGIDNDDAMLAAASKRLADIPFENHDLATWTPDTPADVIFANAVFQWLPDHLSIMVRLMHHLADGGVMAVQMPDNLDEPSHRLMREVAQTPLFRSYFAAGTITRKSLPPPQAYYEALQSQAEYIDIWHTAYYHVLDDAQAVVEWVKSTGLRPYLEALPEDLRRAFLIAYGQEIANAYPALADGKVMLKFPRLFIVVQKKQSVS
jgi:trans-aconitate 2-methyltransferase